MIKEWYDEYGFGDADVYCPWDVISYVNKLLVKRTLPPQDYWINTGSNDVIRRLLEQASSETRNEIECLIAGESVMKVVNEELTYKELYDNIENVWSVLFTTGYLTQRGEAEGKIRRLVIPNREGGNGYADIIVEIFSEKVGIVIEIKYAEDGDLAAGCRDAVEQIEEKDYAARPRMDGMNKIIKCGIACHVKNCKVVFF